MDQIELRRRAGILVETKMEADMHDLIEHTLRVFNSTDHPEIRSLLQDAMHAMIRAKRIGRGLGTGLGRPDGHPDPLGGAKPGGIAEPPDLSKEPRPMYDYPFRDNTKRR